MYGLFMMAMLAPQQVHDQDRPTGTTSAREKSAMLDGTWTVLSVEKNGQPMTDAKMKTVTIRNNIITCNSSENHDMKVMRIEFGPEARVRVTDVSNDRNAANNDAANTGINNNSTPNEHAKMGVCVLSKDFFALCLHDDAKTNTTSNTSEDTRTSMKADENFIAHPHSKSKFTIILKRAGSQ